MANSVFFGEGFSARCAAAKRCDFEPQVSVAWDVLKRLFGPEPREVSDEEYVQLDATEKSARLVRALFVKNYMTDAPRDLAFVETRVLYNVRPDLTGDRSRLWGDASGIHGCVNPGTGGNVTGLVGPMDNMYGDVSYVWGAVNPRFFGTLTKLGGDITGKWGYCSDVTGDFSGVRGDLTPLVGHVTGTRSSVSALKKYSWALAKKGLRLVRRELRNFNRVRCQGDWSMCWGDATRLTGRNTGLIGDVSGESGDVTGRRKDTAFTGQVLPEGSVIQVMIPCEGASGTEADGSLKAAPDEPVFGRKADVWPLGDGQDWEDFSAKEEGSGVRTRLPDLALDLAGLAVGAEASAA